MKCSQFHCPVACVLSEWSSWAACSKECGGGTRGKTRSVLTPSRNGGMECGVTIEEQACNTGSCRRDCTLAPWTDWEPCTQACGGGMTKRVRHVDVPIRADGRCPSPEHPDRLQWQRCNTQDCVGDEICIARQDLIIAVDASGSLKEEGFSIVREFAYNLTGRYRSEYYGVEDMYIGLVLFGNGEYYSNGTVSAAIEVLELTDDLDAVRTSIQSMTWQKGFTNMMQAFQAADNLLQDVRPGAFSSGAVGGLQGLYVAGCPGKALGSPPEELRFRLGADNARLLRTAIVLASSERRAPARTVQWGGWWSNSS
ncbi:unnamed protein product, partial [Prorocentrum cordatum]